ncbi:unnamed protein product [Spodoptera exigua]|nr:unnamed protein product [Spodoptera exigua]
MFAGGGAGFQKQSKPPWESTNTSSGADIPYNRTSRPILSLAGVVGSRLCPELKE